MGKTEEKKWKAWKERLVVLLGTYTVYTEGGKRLTQYGKERVTEALSDWGLKIEDV